VVQILRSKNIVIWLLIILALGIGGALWFNQANKQAQASQNALEASYQNHFFNLIENTENLDVLLGKTLASNSERQDIITFVTVWSLAEAARTNLDSMPLDTASMMRSNQYFAQLGDFCYSLAQKLAGGQEISEKEWEKIKELHKENRTIHKELRAMLGLMQEKQLRLGSLRNMNNEMTSEGREILDGFGKLDERLQNEVPTLTYDGPFSDHVVNRKPRGLTGGNINEKEAEEIALRFAEKIDRSGGSTAKTTGEADGVIPSYSVALQSKDGDKPELVLGISKKGGHVVFMLDVKETPRASKVSVEKARETAEKFISKLGSGTFIETGHIIEANEIFINYALVEDNIVIYPDMIQVVVSLDSGRVSAYDAKKYLLSHTRRTLPQPKLTEAEARERVNKNLQIEDIRLVLIPLGNLEEELTYEVKGKIGEETYYVYINTETGLQEKILLIVETPQGSRSI
jgi:spore germination protein